MYILGVWMKYSYRFLSVNDAGIPGAHGSPGSRQLAQTQSVVPPTGRQNARQRKVDHERKHKGTR